MTRRYAPLLLAALAASLELIERIGLPAIGAHNRALAQQLVDALVRMPGVQLVSPLDPALRGSSIHPQAALVDLNDRVYDTFVRGVV